MNQLKDLIIKILERFRKPTFERRVHPQRHLYLKQACVISTDRECNIKVYVVSEAEVDELNSN